MNDEQDWYRRHNAEPRRLQPHEWLMAWPAECSARWSRWQRLCCGCKIH